MNKIKNIVLLGASGSIGVNTLNCVRAYPNHFNIIGLSTNTNVQLLLQQAHEFKPECVAVTGRDLSSQEKSAFQELQVTVFTGRDALVSMIHACEFDLLVNAVVGAAGFVPTLTAIDKGVDIALANKETLVVGGEIVMHRVQQKGVALLPIDSEHSALFQSLMGEDYQNIEEIWLTASGGPFRDVDIADFKNITVERALKHPNWEMGQKITIDSATMMNKGLEVIEAKWLFDVHVDIVKPLIHPQSIIHSMVTMHDGSIKAQLGVPDMRVPIQLALSYPERLASDFPRLDFYQLRELTFYEPDLLKFRCLAMAIEAVNQGGAAAAVMNAANEIAVNRFLKKNIRFDQIADLIEKTLNAHNPVHDITVESLITADAWARNFAIGISFD